MYKIKVSIITVVYNSESTLEETILSVLNQSYKNIEYIIIDGGSTDGSVNIIKKYATKIDKWITEKDNGIADGFNKGIALASGDIIGIINADDWYEPNTVEIIVDNLDKENAVYCGNINLVTANRNIRQRNSKVGWLNFGMYIMHPSVFVKKKAYKKVGLFNTNFKIAMDFDMLLRIKKAGFKIKYINKVFANMRMGGASSNIANMRKEELLVRKQHLDTFPFLLSLLFNYVHNLIRK